MGGREEIRKGADENIKGHLRDATAADGAQDSSRKLAHKPLGAPPLRISPPATGTPKAPRLNTHLPSLCCWLGSECGGERVW